MIVDYLIIGQGISGTWLSYYLAKENTSFLVIDDAGKNSSSRIAAGIINPVTGRRIVKTWMIDELLGHLVPAYKELGNESGIKAIEQKNIIEFFSTPQMKQAFEERMMEDEKYLKLYAEEKHLQDFFHTNFQTAPKASPLGVPEQSEGKERSSMEGAFGFGEINPCYLINLQEIIQARRKMLKDKNQLLEERFDIDELKITKDDSGEADKVIYKNITAGKIIFCDGAAGFDNPYFKNLPYSLNKGEVLIIEAPDLPASTIYKKGLTIAPLPGKEKGYFWIGSNYTWDFTDVNPTAEFRTRTEQYLKDWLKVDFKIADHKAAIRPANLERRPFAGLHPVYKNIGILNGMGTKGCSLAPYFAKQLADHLIHGKEILPEADVKRFQKILARNT
jgi:glycine/D-amino acid oxidase-like deaminating enzyme